MPYETSTDPRTGLRGQSSPRLHAAYVRNRASAGKDQIPFLQAVPESVVATETVDHDLCCVARRRPCPRQSASPKMYPVGCTNTCGVR
jgi:hypothetical protein